MKRVNGRLIKIHRCYSVEEAARCLRVHKNTVRRWLCSGLAPIDTRRPLLIHGATLRAHLESERRRRRQRCRPGELFCLRCRAPQKPAGQALEYLATPVGAANLRGVCDACGALMHRRVARDRVVEASGDCSVAYPQGQ